MPQSDFDRTRVRFFLTSGEGVLAKAEGSVTAVSPERIAVDKREYALIPPPMSTPAQLDTGNMVLPQVAHWQVPVVETGETVEKKELLARGITNIFHNEPVLLTSRYNIFEPVVVTTTRGTGSGWLGMSGRINAKMLRLIAPDLHERHVFMCGSEGFMDAVRELLSDENFDLARLHAESFGSARIVRPEPAAVSATEGIKVAISLSGKEVVTDRRTFLLDLAESQDIDVDYTCRSGNCGDCKVRLVEGEAKMACEDGLTAEEKAGGYGVSCVATPLTDCKLEI